MARGINDEHERAHASDDKHEIDDCKAVGGTDKALRVIGVHAKDPDKHEWIPLSQIHDDSEVYEPGHEGTLVVKGWFARKNGWA